MIAALALTAALAMGPVPADLDTFPPVHPPGGPTCYGANWSNHVWNLFNPMEEYAVDSCFTAELVAARNETSNYGNFLAVLTGKVPQLWPLSVYTVAWSIGNGALAQCAARGRGVILYQSSSNGAVVMCSTQ